VTESSPTAPAPSIDFLREVAAQQGVSPTDDDLAAVLGFLEVVLPRLAELEARIPPGTPT
jgi:hypothetical protein